MFSSFSDVCSMEFNSILTIMLELFVLLTISVSGDVQSAENIPNFETIVFGLEPSFDVPIINVTVQEGDTAVLPCSVDFLGEHKVAWTDQWNTLLTLDDRRIIDDSRISIERPYTRDWNLHIRKSEYNDRGQYTCQINTNPVKMKTVMLLVLVPSKIINELSSKDESVREGETVTLVCNVTGVPVPEVTWYKIPDDGSQAKERLDLDPGISAFIDSCSYTLKQTGIGTSGEVLIIHNVSRYCDGTYQCMAYNGVDPAVTRPIKVFVKFPPEVSLPTKRIGQYQHRETILDCEITAYPHGQMYWTKDGMDIDLTSKDKYHVELYSGNEDSKRKTLSLRVKDILMEDYGSYTCVAKNYLGSDRETMILYDYSIHEKLRKTTTEASKHHTLRPPKKMFPGDGSDTGIVLQPEEPAQNEILISRPDLPGYNSAGNRGFERPHKTGEDSAALGSRSSASSISSATFHFISCLITLSILLEVL